MLRACVIDFGGSWDQFLPLAEVAYNNSYQSSIQIASYEALYGRQCRSPVGWFELSEARLLGTDLVQGALKKVKLIQERLRMTQSRQRSYADRKVRDVAYMVGEKVMLKISLMKSVLSNVEDGLSNGKNQFQHENMQDFSNILETLPDHSFSRWE
ncbi:uncharacterized protein [Nicotiana tomentosiformis]|uniref:uncharacterized protein n=1 Tax=Nicotiana tomentosiformis TaxID=4098 RepID=UPI00388C9D2A